MRYKGNLRTLTILGVIIIMLVYYLVMHTEITYIETPKNFLDITSLYYQDVEAPIESNDEDLAKNYLVWSPKCKILDMDPWDVSITKFINKISSIECARISPLTNIERRENVGNILKIREDIEFWYKIRDNVSVQCCYSVITRVSENFENHTSEADNKYSVSPCQPFEGEAVLSNVTQFLYVNCTSTDTKSNVYENVHSLVPILPDVMKRMEDNREKPKKLNVLLIGIDSMSRLALQRMTPKTADYFKQNKWIELKGYTKIGENTYPNLLGILSGRNSSENYRLCTTIDPKRKNLCRLLWDDFKENGYVTAYAEDNPTISTFNYHKTGFVQQPTDYYLRPLLQAGEKLETPIIHEELEICLGPVSSIDHILDYAKRFSKTFNDYNFFGLFWMNSFSHSDLNLPAAMDLPIKTFLTDLEDIGTFENTLVVIFSDHGIRFGSIRNTFLGYYEERLPMINIWVPKWYREKYPDKYNNLLKNQNRLTNPYDVYLTLANIVNENSTSEACPKCKSLFEEIPWNRSCRDAAIDDAWCMCSNFKKINLTDPLVIDAGGFLFREIESETQRLLRNHELNETLCAERTLLNVTEAFQSIKTDDDMETKNELVLRVETEPGPATFEAKIEISQKNTTGKLSMKVMNSISRLDSYAETAKCIEIEKLKYLCHCQ